MKPFDPKTVTTSPEKEDRPPRPRFMEAVLRALPGLTCGARGGQTCLPGPGAELAPRRAGGAGLTSEE